MGPLEAHPMTRARIGETGDWVYPTYPMLPVSCYIATDKITPRYSIVTSLTVLVSCHRPPEKTRKPRARNAQTPAGNQDYRRLSRARAIA